ncbi:MAG: hypothetical protein GW772_05375 [Flavobacteriia bacterium]|nr:hypothetical protein [Flavobacteriia bacterium]OIP47287.1 MAG: hypothetical protein AUK46_05490 [Flavobacteriaceae bacterium CG2_30_31_66]PIV96130.1 MAG: hypothetical protein COW43_09695 [Flavobacteriaceae bacterium CG17_big_fil_post_rev_8_21_14_2_50_31_13]PIX13824.1 MAG: hypothetical protein COZ74_04710 [Flavobacteriaceae bacterium CG_4_8_14_3_um_filter_31_8]PIY14347.1 MAG: hypothetical protein COZ16_09425 [Flavobacteriaceae bacterium CG_4_10_14_3_um_filter_31_253]PIZ10434.1 MAG: hypotheti
MIQIYRKLRQQLLTENKFQKYLMYAFGEIFLVVIGILLALQFNNWSIENANKVKEEWYLINMVEDIEYQRDILKEMKEHYENCVKTSESILKSYKKEKNFRNIDSLNEKLNLLMEVDNFPNINNTYQELISSGQQALIKNKELSVSIIDYYLFSEDNYIDIKNNNDNVYYRELHPMFYDLAQIVILEDELYDDKEHLFETDDEIETILEKKLENEETKIKFLNALKSLILINQLQLEMIDETIKKGRILVQKIDEELGLTPEMDNQTE